MGGPALIFNLQSIGINQVFPEGSIRLHLALLVESLAVDFQLSSEDSAVLLDDFLPV